MKDKIFLTISVLELHTRYKNEDELDEYFRTVSNAGINSIRIMPYWLEKDVLKLAPWKYGSVTKKFNLTKSNPIYFERLRVTFKKAKKYNIAVIYDFFDDCMYFGKYKEYNPWSNNVQGIRTHYDARAEVYRKKWIEDVVEVARGTRTKFVPSLGNELGVAYPCNANLPKHMRYEGLGVWAETVLKTLMTLGYKKDIHFSCSGPQTHWENGSSIAWILSKTGSENGYPDNTTKPDWHGIGVPEFIRAGKVIPSDVAFLPNTVGAAWFGAGISNDGVDVYGSDIPAEYKGNVDISSPFHWQAPSGLAMQKVTLEYLNLSQPKETGVETLPREVICKGGKIDLTKIDLKNSVLCLSKAYEKYYGIKPMNFGKYPKKAEVKPIEIIEPEPEPKIIEEEIKVNIIDSIISKIFGKSCWYITKPKNLFWIAFVLWIITLFFWVC